MGVFSDIRGYLVETGTAWNRFWFTPSDPATLSIIRLFAGAMLLYTHCIWTLDLQAFLGQEGWLPVEFVKNLPGREWSAGSLFYWIDSAWLLWSVHIFALAVFACLMLGLFSRTVSVLAFALAVSYAQRVSPGAYFGLDKVNCMLAMYLMLGPCGARYSLDRIWRIRKGKHTNTEPRTSANLAIRLMQVHLCIVYLFTGLAKLEGDNWLAGTAVWWAVANLEYQSIDMTWLANWPVLVALATHATVFWELFYCCLIWNRFTRPLMLWGAVLLHSGIALFMGMITFGLAMLIANTAFLSPATVRRWADPLASRVSLALTGTKVSAAEIRLASGGRKPAVKTGA